MYPAYRRLIPEAVSAGKHINLQQINVLDPVTKGNYEATQTSQIVDWAFSTRQDLELIEA